MREVTGYPAATLGFSEKTKRWTCFYSYYPDYMCSANTGIVTWQRAQLWKHNATNANVGQEYNHFYGSPVNSEIQAISNEIVSNNKIYKAISLESDEPWDVDFVTPNGQESNVVISDFDTRENIHYTDMYNDINSPGGLLEGDRIRDVTLLAKIKLFASSLTRLFAVNFNFSNSFRSNK